MLLGLQFQAEADPPSKFRGGFQS